MQPLSDWPDPFIALVELLNSIDQADPAVVTASTAVPAGFTGNPPMYRIRGLGGSDDFITDSPTIDIDTLSNDEATANLWAGLARQLLLRGPHTTSVGVIDRVTTITRPHQVPYGANSGIFNATSTYRFALRRSVAF
jgi:hypothetical protein